MKFIFGYMLSSIFFKKRINVFLETINVKNNFMTVLRFIILWIINIYKKTRKINLFWKKKIEILGSIFLVLSYWL